jgi:hypothetical protein
MTTGQREEARTSDGLIWTDLPYLALDLQEFATQLMNMSATHRRNLAAFTARVTGLGIADLSSCALWLLRETLEVGRPVIMSDGVETVSIAELLPACIAWFQYSSHKLLRLSPITLAQQLAVKLVRLVSEHVWEILPVGVTTNKPALALAGGFHGGRGLTS